MTSASMAVAAITLDAGGTLLEVRPSVGCVYAAVASEFGVAGIAPADLDSGFRRAWQTRGRFDYSREAWFAIVRRSFGDRAGKLPPEFFPALYERFARGDVWRIYSDVLPALLGLRQRALRLAVISNWDTRRRGLLEQLQLARFFEVLVISQEVGAHKPDRRIFDHAARARRLPAGAILPVGDNAREDPEGAAAAGL